MKKSFKLMSAALIALASFVPAQATELIVFDGTATSSEIPINSKFMDWSVYSHQVIYPETMLTGMQGQAITAIKYYVWNEEGSTLNGGNVSLYIGTTDLAAFPLGYNGTTDFVPEDGLTMVSARAMATGVSEIEFTLAQPWTYNGGNIVIQTTIDADGSVIGSQGTFFLGQASAAASACGTWTINAYDFGPKTAFVYDGGDTPEPEVIRGDVNGDKNVSIADVSALIDHLLTDPDQAPAAADCNLDTKVSIADVSALIDYLLTNAWPAEE